MAKLPRMEIKVTWARDELHKGNREKALEFLASAGDGPLANELRSIVSKKGRQPFGSSHRWWEIGVSNDEMRQAGVPYEERLNRLSVEFRLGDPTKVKTAIGKYERLYAELREFEEKRR